MSSFAAGPSRVPLSEEAGKSRLILEPGDRDKAWEMALNPEKWGINVSRKDFQCYWVKRWGDVGKNEQCQSEKELKKRMRKFSPDLTNPEFQKIFLERIYRQIDAGADAMVSPSSNEIKDKFTGKIANFNEELLDELVEKIKKEYGILIFARIDYGGRGGHRFTFFPRN